MRGTFRITLAFVLSALIALMGQSLAASRGMNAAVGQVELCTGGGPVMIYVDDTGTPTRPPHYCPDYALTLLGALGVAAIDAPILPTETQPDPTRRLAHAAQLAVPAGFARGPPSQI